MRSVAVLLALTLAACSPEAEVTDSTNKCVTNRPLDSQDRASARHLRSFKELLRQT
jgi:hypothetical protein